MRFPCKVKNNSGPQIVTWADGTDEEIAAMLEAHYNGDIDIHDYWTVGDQRIVTLSAMEATHVGESHAQQDVTYALSHVGGKYLADGVTECAFQVDQVNSLNETGYINNSYDNNWKTSSRRTWCNSIYKDAIPSTLRGIFKNFINQTGLGNYSTSGVENTTDTFALRSEIEVYNSTNSSVSGEGTQIDWYKTGNYVKKVRNAFADWWFRSPQSGKSDKNVYSMQYGGTTTMYVNYSKGISPFGCI